MKFALRNGEKIEAIKGVNDAICPICKALVIPKCGEEGIRTLDLLTASQAL